MSRTKLLTNRDRHSANLVQEEVAKEVRQDAALAHRTAGKSYREIAALFSVSPGTAHRWVREAQQQEQLKRAKGIVGDRLVPKALAVYDQRLEAGDLEAARDILFGAGVLLKTHQVNVTAAAADPLQRFRDKYFGPETPEVVEGEVKQLIEAEEAHESV